MALDEFEEISEDLVVRDARTGNVTFNFNSKEEKETFLNILERMIAKEERNKEEGYKCGNCAAYPCFRTMYSQILFEMGPSIKGDFSRNPNARKVYEKRAREEASRPAGLCFQNVRLCRQECKFYTDKETEKFWPEGICKKDNKEVTYDQECHIPEIKKSRM